jgi:hypothetical protein
MILIDREAPLSFVTFGVNSWISNFGRKASHEMTLTAR